MKNKIVSGLWVFAVYWSMFAPFANGQKIGAARTNRMKNIPPGLTFHLSEGADGAEARVKQGLAPADPLSQGDAGEILKRLPGIKSDPDDRVEFAKRVGTLPAPKAGTQLPVKFPSDEQRGTP
ncbi:MAG: hypothetical protein H0U23_09945, partial [Blastocatellia bacterium]|nr:hypothetical protein [Blastocatellia bacterium]